MANNTFANRTARQGLPSDPLFRKQWHLLNTKRGLLDLNVVDVWQDYTGAGVNVAVIDDGVQGQHPDLADNYLTNKDWDFEDNRNDASGTYLDSHGTAVAGIISASANNGTGGVGIAYDSSILGFRTYGPNASIFRPDMVNRFVSNTASAIYATYNTRNNHYHADIVNLSVGTAVEWSYFDERVSSSSMAVLNQAIDDAVALGRNRLGTILVKSAGNSRFKSGNNLKEPDQNTNSSSWNANPHTISVAAVDQNGFVSDYSTPGSSLLVSAFGTPREVFTTDRVGTAGYNSSGDYTTFNGTSAAAPMVSGVVALMLEANPNLGWRDVQEILAYSARHVGSRVGTRNKRNETHRWEFNGASNWNGGGLHFSNDYGFGLVDAKAAVRLAETWSAESQTSRNEVATTHDFLNGRVQLNSAGIASRQFVNRSLDLEHVEVEVSFTQWIDRGDLAMRLISPSGTSSILINANGDNNESFIGEVAPRRWTFVSNEFRGEDTVGNWTVELYDVDNPFSSPIVVNDIDITFRGQSSSQHDTFVFTEEYSDYARRSSEHSRSIEGGWGTDSINAAAVDSNTKIDLKRGRGRIDRVNVSVSGIENVFSGDGNDELIGDSSENLLSGMRGNDLLIGGAGNDALYGGEGNDFLIGADPSVYGAGQGEYDILTGGAGADVFVLGDKYEEYYSGSGYAIVTDFNWNEGDLFQVYGEISDYSLGSRNWAGNRSKDTLIYYQNDVVGVVQDNTNVNLFSNFNFV